MSEQLQSQNQAPQGNNTTIIVGNNQSNGLGTAGFVLALIGLILCWVPILGQILWFLGLLFSFIGIFKAPRGMAIGGLVISLIGIIIVMSFLGGIGALLSM